MGFSWQENRNGLPSPPPVDHILSELFTMTHLSWVALLGMAHSFWVTQAPFATTSLWSSLVEGHLSLNIEVCSTYSKIHSFWCEILRILMNIYSYVSTPPAQDIGHLQSCQNIPLCPLWTISLSTPRPSSQWALFCLNSFAFSRNIFEIHLCCTYIHFCLAVFHCKVTTNCLSIYQLMGI